MTGNVSSCFVIIDSSMTLPAVSIRLFLFLSKYDDEKKYFLLKRLLRQTEKGGCRGRGLVLDLHAGARLVSSWGPS